MFAVFIISTITSTILSLSCLAQICISSITTPSLLFYRWLLLLASLMTVCINTTVIMYGSKLVTPEDYTLNFICKFFRGSTVLILILISIPFMNDIFHAATESSHLFYKDKSRKNGEKKNSPNTDNNNNESPEHQHAEPQQPEQQHPEHHHHLFKQSIIKHKNMMEYVVKVMKFLCVFGFISYLFLELLSWSLDITETRIMSYYIVLIIAILFSICNTFHHFRVYQHMNELQHFIQTNPEFDPHVVTKFVRIKRRLLFIGIISIISLIIYIISLSRAQNEDNYDYDSYRLQSFFSSNIGYFGYIWSVMLNTMVFHAWCFQSLLKVAKTSMAFCFFQACCFCCFWRSNIMNLDDNIKNLETDVGQFTSEQMQKDGNKNTAQQFIIDVGKLKVDVIGPNGAKQSEISQQQKVNVNLGTNIGKIDPMQLTPYSPSIETPESGSRSPQQYHRKYAGINKNILPINAAKLSNIKVVVYDINTLLSMAYTVKDALELIQNKPIEWMTNEYVRNRIYDFECKRSDLLRKHIEFIHNTGHKKTCIISNGFDNNKMKALINMLKVDEFIDMKYSKDHQKWNEEHNNLSVVLLDIMSHFQCENDQLLFICNDLNQMDDLKQIRLCSLFPTYSYMDNIKIPGNLSPQHIKQLNKYLITNNNNNNTSSPKEKKNEQC